LDHSQALRMEKEGGEEDESARRQISEENHIDSGPWTIKLVQAGLDWKDKRLAEMTKNGWQDGCYCIQSTL